jgi:hypothetical protein
MTTPLARFIAEKADIPDVAAVVAILRDLGAAGDDLDEINDDDLDYLTNEVETRYHARRGGDHA